MKIDPFDKPVASSSFLLSQISHCGNHSPLHCRCLSVPAVASSHGALESISLHRILLLHHQAQQEVFSS
jgi:hypothetical protein